MRANQDCGVFAKVAERYVAAKANVELLVALHQHRHDLCCCSDIADGNVGILCGIQILNVEFGARRQRDIGFQAHCLRLAPPVLLEIRIQIRGRQFIDSIAANIDQDRIGMIQNRRPEATKGALIRK